MYMKTHSMQYSILCLCFKNLYAVKPGGVNVFEVVQYPSLYNAYVY